MRLLGVDFSGARAAGEKIWVAECEATADALHVTDCRPMAARTGTSARQPALAALRDLLRGCDAAGLDVSFGLPNDLHDHDDWAAFLDWFPGGHADAGALQSACRERARALTDGERADLKRATDEPTGASSPYGFITSKQTFHGVRDVLAPLVAAGAITCPPMQTGDGPTVCEVYPAATLRRLGLPDTRYKGGHEGADERRRTVLDGLLADTPLSLANGLRGPLLDDGEGDGLDAVVAAVATHRAWRREFAPEGPWHPVEGHIFV